MFCLNKNLVKLFLEKIKSGEIDPKKLAEASSKERHELFKSFMGEKNAEKTNTLLESKLLLKNQQAGMISWAKEVSGLKGKAQSDVVSRINKMTEVLNPRNEQMFLADLAAHKLEATVTMGEAARVSELATDAAKKKAAHIEEGADRMEYGRALVDLGNYVSDLKNESNKTTFEDFKRNPGGTAAKIFSDTAGLAKSLKATLDNSVIGRQGLKTMISHPTVWLKNSAQSFVDIARTFGGAEVMNEVRADVLSRPNALNGLYKKEKVALGTVEEAYPTSLPEKVPVLGKVFKASEAAFTAFQYRTRADVFDKYVEIAQKTGADITGIGKVVNALTGRGTFGQRGESMATVTNNVFFSPRFLKSNIDLLTVHAFDSEIGPFARKEAAINTLKVVSGIAAVLTIAKSINPGSVEEDPRSADFGKIRVADTRFDVTGGMSSLAILAARLVNGHSKSSVSGKVSELNSGKFGSLTKEDVIINFFENKLSPVMSVMKDILQGEDQQGNKPTALNELKNLFMPLPITTYLELKNNPKSANIILAMIADALGISTNTYSKKTPVKRSIKK